MESLKLLTFEEFLIDKTLVNYDSYSNSGATFYENVSHVYDPRYEYKLGRHDVVHFRKNLWDFTEEDVKKYKDALDGAYAYYVDKETRVYNEKYKEEVYFEQNKHNVKYPVYCFNNYDIVRLSDSEKYEDEYNECLTIISCEKELHDYCYGLQVVMAFTERYKEIGYEFEEYLKHEILERFNNY